MTHLKDSRYLQRNPYFSKQIGVFAHENKPAARLSLITLQQVVFLVRTNSRVHVFPSCNYDIQMSRTDDKIKASYNEGETRMDGNFTQAKELVFQYIGDGKIMVLSTYANERLTSRTINAISFNGDIYFICNKASTKYKQILQNPQIALCENSLQITGRAEVAGHPLAESNEEIKQVFVFAFTDWFNQFAVLPDAVLIKVVLTSSMISLSEEHGFTGYSIDY